MESEIETANFDKKGWIGKIKEWSYENWQTILIVLIVLIIGVSAYNYNQQNNLGDGQSSVVGVSENESEDVKEDNNSQDNVSEEVNAEETLEADTESEDQEKAAEEDNETEAEKEPNGEPEKNIDEDTEENNSVVSNSDDSGKTYLISAVRGDGITHLARQALNKYLQETGKDSGLTAEHEIYIEDYLQNRTGNQSIEINHQETFSESLIEEAISSAKQLTPKSLNNLKKYVR